MNKIIEADIKEIIKNVGDPLNQLQGKSLLISGGCGFLGSWFIAVFQYLNQNVFEKPVKVLAIDSFIATEKQNHIVEVTDENIVFKKADISKFTLAYKVDYIIHAAGIASPVYYRKFPIETIDGMLLGLSNLLKSSINYKVDSFLNFSSSEMYGNPSDDAIPTAETYYGHVSALGPRACYDESKRMGETMCNAYHKVHNIPVKTVRPFNCYGPGMRLVDDRVVPKFIYSALQDKEITIHVPGIQTRTFCYVSDAITGFLKAFLIGQNGESYNIGDDEIEMTINDLALRLERLFGKTLKLKEVEMPLEYPRDQAQRRFPDLTKARAGLNYTPQNALDTGLLKTIEWCTEMLSTKFYES